MGYAVMLRRLPSPDTLASQPSGPEVRQGVWRPHLFGPAGRPKKVRREAICPVRRVEPTLRSFRKDEVHNPVLQQCQARIVSCYPVSFWHHAQGGKAH